MLKTGIGQLRVLGFLEGLSYIILLFIAVPFKYLLDEPILVKIVGQIHGLLFVAFVIFTLILAKEKKWDFKAITGPVLLSSIIPFGTFYVDRKILTPLID